MKFHPNSRFPAFLLLLTIIAVIGHFASQPAKELELEEAQTASVLEQCTINITNELMPNGMYGYVDVACDPLLEDAQMTILVIRLDPDDDAGMPEILSRRQGGLIAYTSSSLLSENSVALCVHIISNTDGEEVTNCHYWG